MNIRFRIHIQLSNLLFSFFIISAFVIHSTSFCSSFAQDIESQDTNNLETKVTSSYIEALTLIEDKYSGKVNYERINESTIDGLLGSLDPHSHFWSRDEFLDFRTRQASQYSGVGATIVPHNNKVYILSPFANTPAFKVGLRYGDQIAAIDGQSTEGWDTDRVRNNLRGLQGTPINVTVVRPGVKEKLTFRIVRDSVELPSITNSFIIRPSVGYIGLRREFQRTTGDEVIAALKDLKSKGATSIILDLRGNPGGLVESARIVADQFLYQGQKIFSYKGRGKAGVPFEQNFTATNTTPDTSSLVILISSSSASASEIVAGALQDHDRGIIVGETSFGKGLVQTIYPLSNGYGLTLTSAKYFTPSGRLIQRSYDGVSLYDYQKKGLTGTEIRPSNTQDFHTDTQRIVKGGLGIEPDVKIAPTFLNQTHLKIQDAVFDFVRLVVRGQISTLQEYKVADLTFQHTLIDTDYQVSEKLIQSFQKHVKENSSKFGITDVTLTKYDVYVKQQLRNDILTAAYGIETASEAFIASDPQVVRGITELPNAKALAEKSRELWQAKNKN